MQIGKNKPINPHKGGSFTGIVFPTSGADAVGCAGIHVMTFHR